MSKQIRAHFAKIQKSLLWDLASFLSPAHPFERRKPERRFAEAAAAGRCTLGRDRGCSGGRKVRLQKRLAVCLASGSGEGTLRGVVSHPMT